MPITGKANRFKKAVSRRRRKRQKYDLLLKILIETKKLLLDIASCLVFFWDLVAPLKLQLIIFNFSKSLKAISFMFFRYYKLLKHFESLLAE